MQINYFKTNNNGYAMKLLCFMAAHNSKIEIFIQIIFPTKEFQLSNKNINKRLFTSTDFPKALFIINTKLYKT